MPELQNISTFKPIYLLISLLGMAMAAMMAYSFNTALQIINVYNPLIHAIEEVQKSATSSHLWLEEMLSGDESATVEDIRGDIASAVHYVDAMRNERSQLGRTMTRVNDQELWTSIAALKDSLTEFRDLAEERLANVSTSGPGTLSDERYDALFKAVLFQSRHIEERLHLFIEQDTKNFRVTQRTLITTAVVMVFIFGFMIYFFERKQRGNLITLNSADKRLKHEQAELNQVAAELARHKEGLERLVDERTAEVKRALKAAEDSSLAKSEFLSCMSHELRTPLNAILGFGQLLDMKQDDRFNDNDKDYIREILHGGNHLLELINDILDLSTIESGHLDIATETIRLNEALGICITMIQPLADQRGILLNTAIDPGADVLVRVDLRRFKQVILNLLSNAVKYNRDSGTVTLSSLPPADDTIRVVIEDTGNGIDPDHQKHIFEPFVRLPTSKVRVSGTGIGLVITKRLIEAMGGHIGFDSTPGQGSRFWVDVPLAERPAAPVVSAAEILP